VPVATWLAELINSCGEPPEVAASVVGAQAAGPSYPTLADGEGAVVVTLCTSLATALTFKVDPEPELPPMREKPKPTSEAKTVVPRKKRTRPRISRDRRGP
jgi:hypothetical protein